jgi:hypothetical protein
MAFEEGASSQEDLEDEEDASGYRDESTGVISGFMEKLRTLRSDQVKKIAIKKIRDVPDRLDRVYNDYLNDRKGSANQQIVIIIILFLAMLELFRTINVQDGNTANLLIAGIKGMLLDQSGLVLILVIILLVIVLLLHRSNILSRSIIFLSLLAALAYLFSAISSEYIIYSEKFLFNLFHHIYSQPQVLSILIFLLLISLLLAWSTIFQRKAISALVIIFAFIAPVCLGLILGKFDLSTLKEFLSSFSAILFFLVQYFGIILILSLIWILVTWISEDEGLVVLPFKVSSANGGYDGKAISDLLVAELDRIIRIYRNYSATHSKPYFSSEMS